MDSSSEAGRRLRERVCDHILENSDHYSDFFVDRT